MHGGSRRGSHPGTQPGSRPGAEPRVGPAKPSGRAAEPRAAEASSLPDSDRLTRLLEPVVHALDMDLESVKVTAAGRRRLLRVVIDADGGVSLDDIAVASRELSLRLDRAAEMGELPYTLEVSSPGVDRPLTQARHWRRATGRLVVAPLRSGSAAASGKQAGSSDKHVGNAESTVRGRIVAANESGVALQRDGVTQEYSYAELGPGRVQVEFGHFDELSADEPGEED